MISASVSLGRRSALVNKIGALCKEAKGEPVNESAKLSPFVRMTVLAVFHPDALNAAAFLYRFCPAIRLTSTFFFEAAVRETMEELNLDRDHIVVHGEMDFIISQYLIIRCFVGEIVGIEAKDISPNEEVETIYTVPVRFFLENQPKFFSVNYNPTLDEEFVQSLGENEFEHKLYRKKNSGSSLKKYQSCLTFNSQERKMDYIDVYTILH